MKNTIDKPIRNFLIDFGLTEKEIVVYMTLLRSGPNTIMNLARETSIKRSTTHNTVEELIKKGLVSQTNYGERRMVIAEDPDKLKFLMDQKKWDVQKMEKNLQDAIKDILELVPNAKENSQVEVKYYQGKEGTSLIYKEAFESKELRSYVNLAATSKVFPENKEFFLNAQKKNHDLKVWEIVEKSPESLELAKMYELSANFKFKSTEKISTLSSLNTLIYDGKVALINFKDSITGVVIQNKDYFEMSKLIFEMLWGSLN